MLGERKFEGGSSSPLLDAEVRRLPANFISIVRWSGRSTLAARPTKR